MMLYHTVLGPLLFGGCNKQHKAPCCCFGVLNKSRIGGGAQGNKCYLFQHSNIGIPK